MDLTETIEPNSQQVNSDDFMAGEQTVTITGVEAGNAEQPVFIHLAEFEGRTYRPSKSMRRVLVSAWGPNSAAYVGRKLTLFRDPTIRFGSAEVGGIVIGLGSRIMELPPRLWKMPDYPIWGREVIVRIPPSNPLLLGEMVNVHRKKEPFRRRKP